jgi:uncharacterized protein YdhG (YjbR/CyaY superfamily)
MGTVSDYLASLDPTPRDALDRVISRARALVPDVEEGTSYGMPTLLHRGKPLVAAMSAAKHLALYPFSAAVVAAVAPHLEGFSLSKGTIRFSVDQPLPDEVLDQVITLRRDQIDEHRPA